jgi:hypothetical protein
MKKILSITLFLSIFFSLNLYAAKTIYLSYENVPDKVYKNQRFLVEIKALVTSSNFDYLTLTHTGGRNVDVLDEKLQWEKIANNQFKAKVYFKAYEGNFVLPKFIVTKVKGFEIIETVVLDNEKIAYSDIGVGNQNFTGVIASQLNLRAYKTKQYNNKEALTLVDIDASNSNLEDFRLEGILEQGISKLNDEDRPQQNLVYYFVTPVFEKKVIFSYFDINTKKYVDVTIPLILQNELVSTQTDLNPNDSTFEKYKKMAIAIVFVIFIFLSYLKRRKIFYFITIVLGIIAIIYLTPYRNGIILKDAYIYILPTKNSTIFFQTSNNLEVNILEKKGKFVKVMGIDKKFIGWVKEDSFGKN